MGEIKTGYKVATEQSWHKINIKMQFNKLDISSIFDKKVYLQKTVRSSNVLKNFIPGVFTVSDKLPGPSTKSHCQKKM